MEIIDGMWKNEHQLIQMEQVINPREEDVENNQMRLTILENRGILRLKFVERAIQPSLWVKLPANHWYHT
jgi:hypothetical protein